MTCRVFSIISGVCVCNLVSSIVTTKNASRFCQIFPGRMKSLLHPQLKITAPVVPFFLPLSPLIHECLAVCILGCVSLLSQLVRMGTFQLPELLEPTFPVLLTVCGLGEIRVWEKGSS